MPAEAHFDENGRLVYNPDRRLDIRWADLIAAVNATEALTTILRHTEIELPEIDEWSLRRHLPAGLDDDQKDGRDPTLPDRESARSSGFSSCATGSEPSCPGRSVATGSPAR